MMAFCKLVGIMRVELCASVTPKRVDAVSTDHSTSAEVLELKCDEVFMCVVMIEVKIMNVLWLWFHKSYKKLLIQVYEF